MNNQGNDAISSRAVIAGPPLVCTLIITNNAMTKVINNNRIQLKQSKAMEMHFYCLRDCEAQKHFKVQWKMGQQKIMQTTQLSTTHLPITGRCKTLSLHLSQKSWKWELKWQQPDLQQGCARDPKQATVVPTGRQPSIFWDASQVNIQSMQNDSWLVSMHLWCVDCC